MSNHEQQLLSGPLSVQRRVALQHELVTMLEKALASSNDDSLMRQQTHYQLARTYIELGRETDCLRTARRLFERIEDQRFARETAKMISLIEYFESSENLLVIAERLLNREPENAGFALVCVRQMRRNNAPREREFRVLQQSLRHNPDLPALLNAAARCAIARTRVLEIEAEAEEYARRLVELRPTPSNFLLYGRLLLLSGQQTEAFAALENVGPRLDPATLGPLSKALENFCALCNENYYRDAKTDRDSLHKSLELSFCALDNFLSASETITADEIDTAVRKLIALKSFFFEFERLTKVSDVLGEHLGTLDFEAFCVIGNGFYAHVLTLLQHALSERVLSRPIKSETTIRHLAETYVSLLLSLGQPEGARTRLEHLASLGLAELVADLLQDVVLLHDFETNKLAQENRTNSKVCLHQMAVWEEWVLSQNLSRQSLTNSTEGKEITYSIVLPNGNLRHGKYVQREFKFESVKASPILLQDSELLIGPKGTILKPHPVHGRYPPPVPSLLSFTPNSVSLLPPRSSRKIDEPVVVLANNNVSRTHSYGHWIIFVLSRLNDLIESGLLTSRRLLMPEGLTPWMKETLTLIGLPDERIIFYPKQQQIIASDAEVVSAIDSSGSDRFRRLRDKMIANISPADTNAASTPFVYLARKEQMRRMILDEERICRMAEKLGYSIIASETLSVAGQVRLFSQVRGLAGPAGSAFANIVFCEDRARALCLKAEEKVSPHILDVAISNNLEFRWLLGRSVKSLVRHVHPLDVPYQIDLNQLERQLSWAMETRR